MEVLGNVNVKGSYFQKSSEFTLAHQNHFVFLFDIGGINLQEEAPKKIIIVDDQCQLSKKNSNSITIKSKEDGKLVLQFATEEEKELVFDKLTQIKDSHVPLQHQVEPELPDNLDEIPKCRICSYNVNFGCCQIGTNDTTEKTIISAINNTQSDIIMFQETTPDWEIYFRRHTNLYETYPYHKYFHYELKEGEQRPTAGGLCILSKYPILSSILIPSTCNWFPGELYIVDTPIGKLQLLNLHLRPPLTESALPLPHAYFTSKYQRVDEVKYYSSFINLDEPIVVCGDFNENVKAPSAAYWVERMKMKSVLEQFDPSTSTWWWQLPLGIKVYAHFDHLFYRNLQCIAGKTNQEGESDHYPIFGDFIHFRAK